ncbi:Kiwa anti-phage protein KwaB-like domain-containing protein [Leuconostoc citreum]|uniref:Kiwa anti-phage protein KwaB-like domain-containing protein n=2 Tax=Leuconostoc citreum TaxID=33964 RepID=UPI00024665D4|nr:Kiwa anti-phage protein KwaB-like domain-containing protein [Leuconostoc citreum]MCJ2166768.1 DUF4868 domain-containing protein [Leuconostoc citreum]MCT3072104.1 DUF4868 domain-containing protein [Leuconostoc citreum]MCT3074026.1 DUF4868 domain-containing protein [Leuconostoc citreum]MDM7642611.1 DUF4868 domain-containing protein [Leuconostoc citreum]QEA55322.1 DUF4868 domain-containing protein [Leuconostoc citreum]
MTDYDKTAILNDVINIEKMLSEEDGKKVDVRLYLLWKDKKEMMFSYSELGIDIKNTFIKRWLHDYSNNDQVQEFSEFNVGMEKTDNLMFCKSDIFPLVQKYVKKTDLTNDPLQFVTDLTTVRPILNRVRGYCAHIYTDDDNVYLFGSTTTFNNLTKKTSLGMIGNVGKKEITKISDDDVMIGFNPKTTCYIHDDVCVIKNKKGFEDLFGLLEEYKKIAKETIKLFSKFPDFYQGIETIQNDLDKRPILYRSVVNFGKNKGIIGRVSQHLEKIAEIKSSNIFAEKYHDLEINDKGIVYNEKALPLLLSLLNEEPVRSIITGDEFVAEH